MRFRKLRELSFISSADVIGTGITSVFWLFLASQISPEEYGEIFYFIGIAMTASAFVIIGTQTTLSVYSSKNIRIESTLYFISLLLGVVASVFLIIFFYKVDVVFLLFGYVINTLAIGGLLGTRSFSSYSKFTLIQKVLTLILGLSFFLAFGSDGILFALAISYIFFTVQIYKGFKETKINFNLLKNRSLFIINNYVVEVLAKLNANLNRLIIFPLLGFAVLGNFSLALQLVNVGLIFTMIVFKYTIPYDAQGQENKNLKKISLVVSIILAFLGVFIAPSIIPIFFPEYLDVIDVIRIIAFSIVPITVSRIFASKLLGHEKNKQIVLSKIISMITFVAAIIILSPNYGIIGLGISYLLSTITESICLVPKIRFLRR